MSREQQKQRTRARLLSATRTSFEQHGFEGTTLRGIAEAAGVAVGTVFVHFEDKRDLLCSALFDDLEQVVHQTLRDAPEGSAEQRLHHLTAALFDHYRARPDLSRMLLRESLLVTGPWRARFAGQVEHVHRVVTEWLVADRDAKRRPPSQDPALAAMAYLSFYYFALLGWIQGQPLDPVGLVDRLVAQHLSPQGPDMKDPT